MKAFIYYYTTTTLFNLAFTIIILAISGIKMAPFIFATIGTAVGILCFNYYFSHQYYFYYNLGYTRAKLTQMLFTANIIIGSTFLAVL